MEPFRLKICFHLYLELGTFVFLNMLAPNVNVSLTGKFHYTVVMPSYQKSLTHIRKFVIQRIYHFHVLQVIIFHDANQFNRLKEPFGLTLSNYLYLCWHKNFYGVQERSFVNLNKLCSQIKMNMFCLSAFFFAFINTASVKVVKPSYRRITPNMIAKRIRKHNRKSKAMLKLKLIMSRKQLI